jgi:cytidine deaminase
LANAVAHGDQRIRALAIAFADIGSDFGPEEALPCGACRQWIAELAPDAEIIICPGQRIVRLPELMPQAFRLRDHADAWGLKSAAMEKTTD